MPPESAIQVAMNSPCAWPSRPRMLAKRVALQSAVPMPAGSPGAATVNSTTAGQTASIIIQLNSMPKTWLTTKGP